MLSLYQRAVRMNNEGVNQFENGNFELARKSFRESLEAIKVGISLQDPSTERKSNSDTVGFQWSKNGPLHADLQLPIPAVSSFIFRRALIIVPVSEEASLSAEFNEESTAIIYNLALSHLVYGFVFNCSSVLNKARKFFEIVLAMRQRRNESTKLDGERLLDTAICNNLGWICEEFCDYNAAQECYQEVSSRLVSLSNSGVLEKHDCEGFITNLVCDVHPCMAAAA